MLLFHLFLLEPFNNKSNNIFSEYETIFYSNLVKKEYERIFKKKQSFLSNFFQKLIFHLNQEDNLDFNERDLKYYVKSKFSIEFSEIENIITGFWSRYIKQSISDVEHVKKQILICLDDLKFKVYLRNEEWNSKSKFTKIRTNKYLEIHRKLNQFNVHFPDDEIVLDAHDHNEQNNRRLDFITFDDDFYKGICKIKEFSFNSIKSYFDYL